MRRTRVLRWGAALTVCAFVLTGCRGDGGGGGGGGGGGDEQEISAPGVTSEACPDAVNEDNGCIYLGQISDLTQGPFAPLAVPITEAQERFWQRVNEDGGIGGYDIDVSEYIRDNLYNPQTHAQVYEEIKGQVLALAQTLGTPTTMAVLEDMKAEDIVAMPASWTSLWEFEDIILESGAPYCYEAMNAVDWAVEERQVESVMSIGYPGDYGDDAAGGAQAAAEANGIEFTHVETSPGQEAQAGAISAIMRQQPDLVILAAGPTETAVIVGQAAAQGYQGQFVGLGPTWNPALLDSPAAQALQALFVHSGPWESWGSDTPGHEAMREAIGEVSQPNDGYTAGWVWAYPVKAALEEWLDGDYEKTRAGLAEAVKALDTVDYEGMLPEEAGNYADEPNEAVFRETILSQVDPEAPTGLTTLREFTAGPTASDHELSEPCFEAIG